MYTQWRRGRTGATREEVSSTDNDSRGKSRRTHQVRGAHWERRRCESRAIKAGRATKARKQLTWSRDIYGRATIVGGVDNCGVVKKAMACGELVV